MKCVFLILGEEWWFLIKNGGTTVITGLTLMYEVPVKFERQNVIFEL